MDEGKNRTSENLKAAQRSFYDAMMKISKSLKDVENWVVQINIKGFSRGGATASVFAAWIKKHIIKKEWI